jgi:hypothetical protein
MARAAYLDLLKNYHEEREGTDWKKNEEKCGPKLLHKGRFAATETRFPYVTDDRSDCQSERDYD